jgi:hypothetical protein
MTVETQIKIKLAYVGVMRGMARVAKTLAIIDLLDRLRPKSRFAHWLRNLFAIYDIDAVIALEVSWWTYDAIAAVDQFLAAHPQARVFGYGSGASTIWLARRAGAVTSVEHKPDWAAVVQAHLDEIGGGRSATLKLIPADSGSTVDEFYHSQKAGYRGFGFSGYARSIEAELGLFDLIVIDGRIRQACLVHAEAKLAPDGMIVFDNSHWRRYREAISRSMLSRKVYHGTPSLPYPDQTALLRRNGAKAASAQE